MIAVRAGTQGGSWLSPSTIPIKVVELGSVDGEVFTSRTDDALG